MGLLWREFPRRKPSLKRPRGGSWEHGRAGENASPGSAITPGNRPQITCVSPGTAPPGVSASTFHPLNGFWVGWGRDWWGRIYLGPSLYGPCPLLDSGFWRRKFDPNLTRRDTFHLDEQFTVPVDMMQARTYPLRWFLLEQPEIQVTLGSPSLGLGAGRWRREWAPVQQAQGSGVCRTFLAVMSLGRVALEGLAVPPSRETEAPGTAGLVEHKETRSLLWGGKTHSARANVNQQDNFREWGEGYSS